MEVARSSCSTSNSLELTTYIPASRASKKVPLFAMLVAMGPTGPLDHLWRVVDEDNGISTG
eukprot:6195696-Pleurochrysis_carterae.AAC.1